MMNEKILINYKAEVLEIFKAHYVKLCAKNLELEFKNVLNSTFLELGISNFSLEEVKFLNEWFDTIDQYSFIKNIITSYDFNEIIFHSNESAQIIQSNQKMMIPIDNISLDDYQLCFEIFALRNGVSWNYSEPFASFTATLANNEYRVTLIHHSTSANRKSKIFLRAIKNSIPCLNQFKDDQEVLLLLKNIMINKKNILISGSTGSGKTTFMRALFKEIPTDEHVVILEDTHEIMTFSPNQTSMLARHEVAKKSLKDYCSYALRMSPDRLLIGEMRSTEVVPFMLAMNTGHKGLMSTIHANSAADAITRIALLFSLYSENKELDFSLIIKLACKNIDYVIHMEDKKIKEIARIIGSEAETPFYELIHSDI